MPFKSEKQRKWMHANEPEMAKKWEKEESINEADASVIRKKLLKKFGEDPLYREFILAKTPKEQKKALKTLKSIRGGNAVRLMQKYVKKLQGESIKEKLRKVIRQEIKSINEAKEIKFHQIQPKDYIWYRGGIQYFVTKTGPNVLHMGLVNKGKPGSGGSLFASNTKLTRKNFDSQIRVKFIKKITRDKNTLWQESINEGAKPKKGDYVKTMIGVIAKIEKIRGSIAYMKLQDRKSKGYWLNDLKNIKPTDKMEKGKTLWTEGKINEGFEKYHLGGLLDSKLKKRLERAIKLWSGKVDAVGDDYIKFRMSSPDVSRFPALLKKLDHNKNVWIGDKRKNNIWDRRQKINKLEATTSVSVPGYLSPQAFSKSTQNAIDVDDEDDEVKEAYKVDIDKLLQNPKIKKLMQKLGVKKSQSQEGAIKILNYFATNPQALAAFKKLAVGESMAAPFRRRKSRGLGRPMKVGLNESSWSQPLGWSSPEAKVHVDKDITKMSKHLGKTSHDIIKIMMSGVKGGKYDAMDLQRGMKEGDVRRTHYGEMDFIQELWHKVRDGFRRYSKRGKLR